MKRILIDNLFPLLIVLLVTGNVSLFALWKDSEITVKNMSLEVPKIAKKSYFTGCMEAGNGANVPKELLVSACKESSDEYAAPLVKLYGEN